MSGQKLIAKLCHDAYWKWLQECEAEGIRLFTGSVKEEAKSWEPKYEESMRVWQEEVKEYGRSRPTDRIILMMQMRNIPLSEA